MKEKNESVKKTFTCFYLIVTVLILFGGLFSCGKQMPKPPQNIDLPEGAEPIGSTEQISNTESISNSEATTPQPPIPNGQLPWENNPAFLNMLAEYENPFLMAKYKATLQDPLPGELYNVGWAAEKLAGTVVMPGKIFSQNQKLGPYTNAKGYRSGPMYKGTNIVTATGGGVCKIASLLYNITVLSNLPVIERYCHSMTVPYVPPGQDATVCYGVKDFRFMNNTKKPIIIWAQAVENTLYMAFYGQEKPPKVTWLHETLKEIKFWTIYKSTNQLPPGEEKVIIPGQDGYIVKSWVIIEYPDGIIETKSRGKSYYNPLPEVIEKGRLP